MCLATPVKIKKIKDKSAEVAGKKEKKIDLSLIPEARPGDWILCHSGLAVSKIPATDAQKILELNKNCHHNH